VDHLMSFDDFIRSEEIREKREKLYNGVAVA